MSFCPTLRNKNDKMASNPRIIPVYLMGAHQFSYEFFIPRIFFNQVFPIFFPNDEPFTGSGFNTRVYLAHHKISKRQTVPVHFCLEFLSHCISKDPATIIKEGLVYRES